VGAGEPFWLTASMIGGSGPCAFFRYTLAFALQLRKSVEKLSQGSRLVLDLGRCVKVAASSGSASAGLLSVWSGCHEIEIRVVENHGLTEVLLNLLFYPATQRKVHVPI
jgi:hypothetical protein